MIVNKYNQGGGGGGVTPQQVQAQIDSALTPYWDSAVTEEAISAATVGKADAANVTANTYMQFPKWNAQGVITGTTGNNLTTTGFYLNGIRRNLIKEATSGDLGDAYAPESAGNAGEILVSAGHGAPVWSAVTIPDMSAYYTSAQTDEKIASAVTPVSEHLFDVEQVTASALTELHDGLLEVSGDVQTISAATAGKADAANVTANTNKLQFPYWNEQGIITGSYYKGATTKSFGVNGKRIDFFVGAGSADLPDFYAPLSAGTAGDILVSTGNGAPVWSAVTIPDTSLFITSAYVADQHFLTSADTGNFITSGQLETALEDIELPISRAINDLHTQAENFITSADTANYVTSGQVETQIVGKHYTTSSDQSILNIIRIEQSDYNALLAQSATTSTTLYVVVPDSQ